ncbi:hypothetical protein LXL04_014957 [Taraxacum kok-saghyz]
MDMDSVENDDVPMLTTTNWSSESHDLGPTNHRNLHRSRTAVSISIPGSSIEMNPGPTNRVGFTGPLRSERNTQRQEREPMVRRTTGHYNHQNEHLMKSGPLGMCDDPYCTTCPTAYKARLMSRNSRYHLDDVWYRGAKMRVKEKLWLIKNFLFGVMNPHAKAVQQWNQFLVISCLCAIFIDPLFFYLLSVNKECKCIMINWPMTKTIVIFRSMTDLIYLLHILVQFRLAFVSPESRVVGAGDLVDHPRKIALHYLSGFFFLDLFIVLPIPEIIVLLMLPHATTSSGATYAKNLLGAGVLVQYIPRLYRFLPLFVGQSPSGFIFESAWANFVINLLTFFLAGHVVGSSWYMLGLQRVNECLRKACKKSPGIFPNCLKFIDCGRGDDFLAFEVDKQWNNWKQNENMNDCFRKDGFPYGIYEKAVNLILEENIITRYVYSFFWGFQQISTLAGNQTPSYKVWEVLFTMGIIGLGLLLFALLIGNMQNFLQGLGRRRLEMSLRRRDIEHWMGHRHLPVDLRRKVRESEHYNWAATRGVNEEMLMENFPDDLQRDVRRHLFMFVKKVRIFSAMKEPILDAICERLRQKTYIEGGTPLYQGGVVTNMVFIVRGKMESIGENGNHVPLSEGDVFGEELLRWSPENGDTRNDRNQGCRWLSSRTVTCLSNVEAFVLRAADLEEVTTLFAEFLNDRHVQFSIRNQSPYWRGIAATTIQLAWRYYKRRKNRAKNSRGGGTRPSSMWSTLLQRLLNKLHLDSQLTPVSPEKSKEMVMICFLKCAGGFEVSLMDTVGEDDVHEYTPKVKSSYRSKSVSISIPVSSSELNSGEVLLPSEDYKCVVINWTMATILVASRSITDFIYFLRMLIEFRLAYISPESRVVGAGDLVKRPKLIASHYLSGFFFLDLLIVLPIPQMIVLFIQPNGHASLVGSYAKFLLQTVILVQYAPRLYRFLPLLAGQSPSGFMFEAAWANFVINLLTFVLAGHVIGSIWYMLGLLRVNRCFRDVCRNSTIADCRRFIDCGRGTDYGGFEGNPEWNVWKQDENSSACFTGDGFNYGIYMTAVNLTTENSFITRYVYSSFWGLQQISTLGGNQTPSYFVGEVLFTMGVIGLGLLLFALLIGNMQNFLQGLGRRRLEKSLRRRDVEEWMSHRRLPEDIRKKVRESEHYNWAATRGVDEETLMENLPEDLQRDIRRHLFKFIKKGRWKAPEKMGIKFRYWRVMYAVKNFSNGALKIEETREKKETD